MNTLLETLTTLALSLTELQTVLLEENRQLSALKIQPLALQRISDAKSKQLSTVAYYDAQRQVQENQLGMVAPYTGHAELAANWRDIVLKVKTASEWNQQSAMLLERHQQASKALQGLFEKSGAKATLYGAKGQPGSPSAVRACNHRA